MPTNFYEWSATASDNATADSAINWAENQLPGTVNGSARAMMAATARFLKDVNGTVTTGGSANAYTVTPNTAHTAFTNGTFIGIKASFTNTSAATLNFNTLGAKKILTENGELNAGQIRSSGHYLLQYDSALDSSAGAWVLLNPSEFAGLTKDFYGSTAPNGYAFVYGQAISRTTYPALFAALGTTHGTGDGSSTFNLPDRRGRGSVGKDDMGGSAASRVTTAGSSFDGATLGAVGGAQNVTLTTTNIPSHTHTGTTDSGGSHTHTASSGTESATHTHSFTGTTDGQNAQHSHTYQFANVSTANTGTGGAFNYSAATYTSQNTGNASADHAHSFSGATGTESATHTHAITVNSGGSHTHTFTTDATGSGGAHNNMPPGIVCNVIMELC